MKTNLCNPIHFLTQVAVLASSMLGAGAFLQNLIVPLGVAVLSSNPEQGAGADILCILWCSLALGRAVSPCGCDTPHQD